MNEVLLAPTPTPLGLDTALPLPPRANTTITGVRRLFAVEFLTSCGTNFLQVGIFFYTARQFHWSLGMNFALAAGQGATYVTGALLARQLVARFPQRLALGAMYTLMALAALAVAIHPAPLLLAIALLAYSAFSALGWPILESLVSSGAVNEALARRLAVYNLAWSGAGALVLAVNGTIIEYWSRGVFVIPMALHGISAVALLLSHRPGEALKLPEAAGAHPVPEQELRHMRTLALWLSRVSLPATYVVIYSLSALMPSLPVLRRLSTAQQTLVGCSWMAGRWIAFLLLGLNAWWHTRPRVLMVAAILTLAAFVAVVIRPSDVFYISGAFDLPTMVIAQLVLGLALGMVYNASLYFGMALSDGSTEHGGYHEALIGLGAILGPGVGAITQRMYPGQIRSGIFAVTLVVTASVLATCLTPILAKQAQGRRRARA